MKHDNNPAVTLEADEPRAATIWRNPSFLKLWAGQSVSDFGSLVTAVAMPFAAVLALKASPLQMATLRLSGLIPSLLVAPLAGVWVDRLHRRPIMIGAELGRAALLASIPAAAFAGFLTIEHLYAVGFGTAILGIFFDVSYRAYLPSIVNRQDLVEANSKLSATSSIAEVGAFGLGGWMVQALGAPVAILIDAVSFLVSAVSIATIGQTEPAVRPRAARAGLRVEISQGAGTVARDPVLRKLAASAAISSFSGALFGTQYTLYAVNELGFRPGVLGAIFAVGGLSSLTGALITPGLVSRVGAGRSLVLGLMLLGMSQLMLPMAHGADLGAAVLMVVQQLGDGGYVVYAIGHTSIKQSIVPRATLGRVDASLRFVIIGCAAAGTMVSGLAAQALSLRATMAAGALGTILAALWLLNGRTIRAIAIRDGRVPRPL